MLKNLIALSVFPAGFEAEAAAVVLSVRLPRAQYVLRAQCDGYLLQYSPWRQQYVLHSMVREYVQGMGILQSQNQQSFVQQQKQQQQQAALPDGQLPHAVPPPLHGMM